MLLSGRNNKQVPVRLQVVEAQVSPACCRRWGFWLDILLRSSYPWCTSPCDAPSNCCVPSVLDAIPQSFIRPAIVCTQVGTVSCFTATATEVEVPEADAWGGGDVKVCMEGSDTQICPCNLRHVHCFPLELADCGTPGDDTETSRLPGPQVNPTLLPQDVWNNSKRMQLLVHADGRVLAVKADPATALHGFGQVNLHAC